MRWSYLLVAVLPGVLSSCGSEVAAAPATSDPPPLVTGQSDASSPVRSGPSAPPTSPHQPAAVADCPRAAGAAPRLLADATDLEYLTWLTVGGGDVYFSGGSFLDVPAEAPPGSDTAGVVRRVSLSSGQTRELWRGQGIVYRVAAHPDGVTFISYDYRSRGRTGLLHRLNQVGDGNGDQVLASWRSMGASIGLARADGGTARGTDQDTYWIHSAGSGGAVLATSEVGTTVELASSDVGRGLMAVSPDKVFWLQDGIQSVSRAGGPTVPVWRGDQGASALGLDPAGQRLFFATGGELRALSLADGSTTTLATGQPTIVDLVADGRAVYAATGLDGKVLAFPLDGGTPTTLAGGQSSVDQLALSTDGCSVLWLNAADKTIHATN